MRGVQKLRCARLRGLFPGINPKSDVRNPPRCDGATARREEARIRSPNSGARLVATRSSHLRAERFVKHPGRNDTFQSDAAWDKLRFEQFAQRSYPSWERRRPAGCCIDSVAGGTDASAPRIHTPIQGFTLALSFQGSLGLRISGFFRISTFGLRTSVYSTSSPSSTFQ